MATTAQKRCSFSSKKSRRCRRRRSSSPSRSRCTTSPSKATVREAREMTDTPNYGKLNGGGSMTVRTFALAALLVSLVCSSASAGTYLDFSTHHYQRFEPRERFQVDTRVHVYRTNDRAQY